MSQEAYPEPNTWKAEGIMDKEKTIALLHALLETVKQYPERRFKFELYVEGLVNNVRPDPHASTTI